MGLGKKVVYYTHHKLLYLAFHAEDTQVDEDKKVTVESKLKIMIFIF